MTTWRGGSEEIWRKYPGFVVSGVLHGLGLLALVVSFTRPEKFPEPTESVQVDMLTLSQFDEVMNGENTGKLMPKPERRVDKVAEIEDHKPATPLAEAKKDTPSEDSPDKPSEDPGQAAKTQAAVAPPPPAPPVPVTPPSPAPPPPPPVAAVEPPKPEPPKPVPPPEPAKPAPLPPQRPVAELEPVKPEAAKPDAPTPPPKPDEVKPPPPEAEIVAPKPPPRPKIEPKKEVKQDAKPKVAKVKPVSRPRPPVVKEARIAPEPPPKVVEPPPTPPVKPDLVDRVANLLNAMKPTLPKFDTPKPTPRPEPTPEPPKVAEQPKPAEKARAGNAVREAKARDNFSLAKISALLDREPAQRKASTGKQLTQMASLGAPNGHADRMSPSMKSQLDNWLIDHYRGCWTYIGLGATQDYVPTVRVVMAPDGSLIGRPSLTNPTSDPNLRSLADSAIRAVNRCNPMDMPDRFKPFYDSWRDRLVRFDPKEMS